MKWNRFKYLNGDIKVTKRFAWWPVMLASTDSRKKTYIWLEQYFRIQEYYVSRWSTSEYWSHVSNHSSWHETVEVIANDYTLRKVYYTHLKENQNE